MDASVVFCCIDVATGSEEEKKHTKTPEKNSSRRWRNRLIAATEETGPARPSGDEADG